MFRRITPLLLLALLVFSRAFANEDKKVKAIRTPSQPVIDGKLNDGEWLIAEPITDFLQTDPYFKAKPSQPTEVRILYDNRGVYIGARLYDSSPDSILTQLGNRDDHLNSDLFTISFDTYSNGLDAFSFEVYASGVQRESRLTDRTFNAVWESAVEIDAKGWTVEIRIPWSAIRFPDNAKQNWRLQLQRNVRRNRETIQWAPEPKTTWQKHSYWGYLNGFEHIQSPIRLSLSPYFSAGAEHFPYNVSDRSNYSTSFHGGADLKYGVSKSFTLDMTLLPDFSTVASDHEIKNLTAFETIYDEKREFFKEGMELFMKGNLFYTRRIGRRPAKYFSVPHMIGEGSTVLKNPTRAQLINASKLSGRTSGNLGIGIFNAVTAHTYATYKDVAGNENTVLTDPLSNYNIVVLDQGLRDNSSVYLINTNVMRASADYANENVTGTGISLLDKSKTYRVEASASLSQNLLKTPNSNGKTVVLGYRYNAGFSRIRGKFQYALNHNGMDSKYSINALGMVRRNNLLNSSVRISYNQPEPFGWFLRMMTFSNLEHNAQMDIQKTTSLSWATRMHSTTRNYFSLSGMFRADLIKRLDYYEPRTAGRFFEIPRNYQTDFRFSTDYRKALAVDIDFEFTTSQDDFREYEITLEPIVRFSNQWTLQHSMTMNLQGNNKGYVRKLSANEIVFGNRDLKLLENTLSSRYMFRNNLSLSLLMRHYWFRGDYDKFFTLNTNGRLDLLPTYTTNHDFNFNTLNIDLVFDWEFAPGSNLSLVYKNSISQENDVIINHYFRNVDRMLESDQLNSLTFRLLYYLDYHSVINRKKNPVG